MIRMRPTLFALAGVVLAAAGKTRASVVALIVVLVIGAVVLTMLVNLRRVVGELEAAVEKQAASSAKVKAALHAAGIEVEDDTPEET